MKTIALMSLAVAGLTWAQPPAKDAFAKAQPALGTKAPAFVLEDLDGKEYRLKDILGKRPIVIEFGSYT